MCKKGFLKNIDYELTGSGYKVQANGQMTVKLTP